jgi:hypothetical protein
VALPLQQIGSIHASRDDVDQHFARARRGIGPLDEAQNFGGTEGSNLDGLHWRFAICD